MKKHSKISMIIICWIGFSAGLWAQQVVSASGNTFQNNEGSISFTIGELTTETYSTEDKIITQGFHQTTITITSIDGTENENFSITAYPNPTCDIVNLQLKNEDITGITYILYDASGKDILSGSIENIITEISFSQLKTAIYFLKIETEGKELKTFKIIKE